MKFQAACGDCKNCMLTEKPFVVDQPLLDSEEFSSEETMVALATLVLYLIMSLTLHYYFV